MRRAYHFKNRIKRFTNPRKTKHKGHEIILKYKSVISSQLQQNDIIIEIGSDREAGSTKILAELAKKNQAQFITVDVDEETSQRAETIVKRIDPSFQAINDYGEVFLSNFSKPVKLIYLDAFDLPGNWHTPEILENYKRRKIELNLENCYKMHYDAAKAIAGKIPKGGFVCFDDVNPVDKEGNLLFQRVGPKHMEWSGKGKTAIPYLLENGFEIIYNIRACVLMRKVDK